MKSIYSVKSSKYSDNYQIAFGNRQDAVKCACAMHEVDAAGATAYIKELIYYERTPQKIDLCDVDRVVDLAISATLQSYDRVSEHIVNRMGAENES